MKITDVSKIKHNSWGISIPDEYLVKEGYSVVDGNELTGMKAVGRIYYSPASNLDYTTGEPVEMAYITGGERGVTNQYMRAGVRVFTEEQVLNMLNSRCYEANDELKPKLPEDVYDFLEKISKNTAKRKPSTAAELLEKYNKIGEDD